MREALSIVLAVAFSHHARPRLWERTYEEGYAVR